MGKQGTGFIWPWRRKKARAAQEEQEQAIAALKEHQARVAAARERQQEYASELELQHSRAEELEHDCRRTEQELQASSAAESSAEENLQAARREHERREQKRQHAEAEVAETHRLEEELAKLGSEAQWLHQQNEESSADAEAVQEHGRGPSVILGADHHIKLAQEIAPLVAERRRLEPETQEVRAQAAALEAELPGLHKTATETRRRCDSSEAQVRRLHEDLRRVETDLLAEAMPSPTLGQTPEPPTPSGAANIQEVWKLESEAGAAAQRVIQLEQDLEEACMNRQAAMKAEVTASNQSAVMNSPGRHPGETGSHAEVQQQQVGSPGPLADRLTSALWHSPASGSLVRSPGASLSPPLLGTPSADGSGDAALGSATAKYVAENGRLRVEAEALQAAVSQHEEAARALEHSRNHTGLWSSALCSAEPQLEPGLSFSRNRLRAMLQEQLEDSRRLLAALKCDVAEAERSLWKERCGREQCEMRLRSAEGCVAADSDRSSVCREAANSSPPPQPPSATTPVARPFPGHFLAEPGSDGAGVEAALSDWGDSQSADSEASTSPLGPGASTSWLV